MENVANKIKEFLSKYIDISTIADETDLFGEGYVNSLFVMQLMMFLEKEFSLTISNDELDIDNFKNISSIVGYIKSKI